MSTTPTNDGGDPIGPRIEIERPPGGLFSANMTFGPDAAFDITITVDPKDIESHAPDGAARPCVRMTIGGIDDADSNDSMVRVFRALNENELRYLSKMCLSAAGECKRLESRSRSKLSKPHINRSPEWFSSCQIARDHADADAEGEIEWWSVRSPDGQMYLCENTGKWRNMPQAMGGWFGSESSARNALTRAAAKSARLKARAK